MTVRQIECSGCGCNLGEIRDARLRKDIRYLCGQCYDKREAAIAYMRSSKFDKSEAYKRFFGDWLK